ncbi:MAG TPA: 50S ribosomal protein L18 [Acidimicrobiia bacterium]|nr:50S ribosomal protein L18 [Acidimicrobiia bacterium]
MGRRDTRDRRRARVRRKLRGTSARPRLLVYRSNKYIYAQVVDDKEGVTVAAASSQEPDLRSNRLNVDTAAKVGTLVADRAKEAGVTSVVFDRGGYKYHGRLKALADAAREAGLEF